MDPHGRHRGCADLDAVPRHGYRPVLQSGCRPEAAQNPGGEIQPAFLCVVLANCGADHLRRGRWSAAARLQEIAVAEGAAPDLAARCDDGTAADHLTRRVRPWPNSCKGRSASEASAWQHDEAS